MSNTERKPAKPIVGQLKTGEWVIFNMPETPLWDAVFPSCEKAAQAYIIYLATHPTEKSL